MRFTNAHTIDPPTYSGIAALGGWSQSFAGDSNITLDGKIISARFPGSGAISEVWSPWNLGIPAHEFGEHYSYGYGHSFGLGSFQLNGGGLASAYDREWIGWNAGNQYAPTSNTSITLRDYITTGDYAKIIRNGHTLYLENRRRFSYYASENYKGVRWFSSEPLYPQHADSGLYVYKYNSHRDFRSESANGNWDWQKCGSYHYRCDWSSSTFNILFHDALNRNNGQNTFDLYGLQIKDKNCNTITGIPNLVNYRGAGGDSNSFFDVGYNDIYSPWSNPPLGVINTTDSLTVELGGRDNNGDMIVNIYFTNITDAKPSKPQELAVSEQYIGSQETHFYPRLDWEHNLEPDLDYYKIYRGQITTPGVEPTYSYIGSTSNNYFTDQNIILYVMQGGSGICTYQYKSYAYKITAVDEQSKESVKSLRDTIDGYTDPCAPDDNIGNTIQNFDFSLEQNYPNPFNPQTIITYSLKEDSFVTLKLYDTSGREIKTLVSGLTQQGKHKIIFNTESEQLASGIYFYKLIVLNNQEIIYSNVRRLVLIK